jgi:hypothetical protein
MAKYNPYRWWTKGRPNKPLKTDAPLLLKIRNGDFDYSYMFGEALDEDKILFRLRQELKKEFGKDLWDKAMERQRGKGTLEDLYEWYRKNSKVKNPQSIQDIQLRKSNTKGLDYLF